MTYRVIQWAPGVVAREAVAGVVGHPDLELTGAWVHSADKDGRDVGELCGLDPLGVLATRDKDALLATDADCVCFTVGRNWVEDPTESFEDLLRILRSGKNVVNLWWPTLVYPRALAGDFYKDLEKACLEGGTSFCTVGMDPGYGTAGLALSALTLVREVSSVHMYQVMNNAHWEGPGITKFFGFGQRDSAASPILRPGVTTNYHATTLHLLADAIGTEIEEIVEDHSVIYADEAFEIASGSIPAGTISGVRYRVKGMVGGQARVVVEHVERLREEDFPELEFRGDGYRAEVTGLPSIRLDMTVSAPPDYTGDPVAVASAMSVVNAIPRVCAAPPGVLSLLDLPPFPSKNSGTRN
ncbi:dihydrodipicolinate reductase [Frankia sp. CNm7]|uniref:Dihydrodipicolinate reductase n=1 Tax=Frankia nepalensis TaxID=1836974 RepID=A0A937RBB9_9ACTN|nr:dihydrodipicolinate reductase [Frankia nepalensis]MBL7502313.1 dihydrodipicolinate reductase [Frankia nepalensis]MBL7516077.1 dihydrodipicolinate reductase [Frankia nepalensis]MBL7522544.1 dihydrodipicolinate reductase [Frankia nepalensis]MBL7627157.1 dihydrodipicolinate reductase [Frankia nepalensis]